MSAELRITALLDWIMGCYRRPYGRGCIIAVVEIHACREMFLVFSCQGELAGASSVEGSHNIRLITGTLDAPVTSAVVLSRVRGSFKTLGHVTSRRAASSCAVSCALMSEAALCSSSANSASSSRCFDCVRQMGRSVRMRR